MPPRPFTQGWASALNLHSSQHTHTSETKPNPHHYTLKSAQWSSLQPPAARGTAGLSHPDPKMWGAPSLGGGAPTTAAVSPGQSCTRSVASRGVPSLRGQWALGRGKRHLWGRQWWLCCVGTRRWGCWPRQQGWHSVVLPRETQPVSAWHPPRGGEQRCGCVTQPRLHRYRGWQPTDRGSDSSLVSGCLQPCAVPCPCPGGSIACGCLASRRDVVTNCASARQQQRELPSGRDPTQHPWLHEQGRDGQQTGGRGSRMAV